MPDQVSHLSQNLEVHHNYLELFDYYHQVSKLFEGYDGGSFGSISEKDNFKAIQSLFLNIQKLESHIALKYFPLIERELFSTESPKSSSQSLLSSLDNRLHSLEEYIANYSPSASILLRKAEGVSLDLKKLHPQSTRCWQQLSFDIALMIHHAPAFDQCRINKTVDRQLKKITQEPHPWSPHRAHQKMSHTFERIHFMVSKLQGVMRLRTTLEQSYSDTLSELVSLSQILKDFESKIIKQKRAEEKRVSDMYSTSALRIKK